MGYVVAGGLLVEDQAAAFAQLEQSRKDEAASQRAAQELARQLAEEGEEGKAGRASGRPAEPQCPASPQRPASPLAQPLQTCRRRSTGSSASGGKHAAQTPDPTRTGSAASAAPTTAGVGGSSSRALRAGARAHDECASRERGGGAGGGAIDCAVPVSLRYELHAASPLSRRRRREDEQDGGEGRGVRHAIDRLEDGKQDSQSQLSLQSQLSFPSIPHSSPVRGAGGSVERHKAGGGAGGVDLSCGSRSYPLPDRDRTQASQGAHVARGDPDDGGIARGGGGGGGGGMARVDAHEGGMAFDIPPELLGDLATHDTHALIQEQVLKKIKMGFVFNDTIEWVWAPGLSMRAPGLPMRLQRRPVLLVPCVRALFLILV